MLHASSYPSEEQGELVRKTNFLLLYAAVANFNKPPVA